MHEKISGFQKRRRSEKRASTRKVLLVGSPNVGKSMLFNRLTGSYVTVSNYPGTTVEVSKGYCRISNNKCEIIDMPGIYSLSAITAEEKVATQLILAHDAHAVVHVIDAKNIERMLGLTLQLIEAGLPVVLVLNMADEARQLGIKVDTHKLEKILGIGVVQTVATTGGGVNKLIDRISKATASPAIKINYGTVIEQHIDSITEHLIDSEQVSKRTRALLLLQESLDYSETSKYLKTAQAREQVKRIVRDCAAEIEHSVGYRVTVQIQHQVKQIIDQAVSFPLKHLVHWRERLSQFCMHPVTGIPLLLFVLYFGIYKFVGGFGAGTMVDFLENTVFQAYINPFATKVFSALLPWPVVFDLIAGEYGIVTLGLRYAVAIVLPIVGTFFVAFSVLEDSGYLPRLAMLSDRVFKKIGLNGRAVIPIVLGFGCATMATMVTRTLETRREKIITSVLLALAIPCSAQLGVILGLLSVRPYALLAWAVFVGATFVLAGTLLARFMPGPKPSFYMELPPLRFPRPGNVIVKTYTRMVWYFKEILPLFIIASVLIWVGQITRVFQVLVKGMESVVALIGLPADAAVAFLFGFFRRDYGAAGLYDLQKDGLMTGNQLAVAAITLTLFLPCIAQFLIFKKECGLGVALISSVCILIVAFVVGFFAHTMFTVLGITL